MSETDKTQQKRKYDDLSHAELVRLLEARDLRYATKFGLVWEANEIERDKALNQDFVAFDLDRDLCYRKDASSRTKRAATKAVERRWANTRKASPLCDLCALGVQTAGKGPEIADCPHGALP